MKDCHHAPSRFSDEQLINLEHPTPTIQRRSDLSLWCSLYREALRRVALLRHDRGRRAAAYASFAAENPDLDIYDWKSYAANILPITVDTPEPMAFAIAVNRLDSSDNPRAIRVWFELRAHRGIVMRFEGFPESMLPDLAHVPFAPRIEDADRIASKMIQIAIDKLDPLMPYIPEVPKPEIYDEPSADESPASSEPSRSPKERQPTSARSKGDQVAAMGSFIGPAGRPRPQKGAARTGTGKR